MSYTVEISEMAKKSKRKARKKGNLKNRAPKAAARAAPADAKAARAANHEGSSPTLQRVARIASIVLGLVFLLAGTLKIADPWSFLGSLPAYGVPPPVRLPVVILMPIIEVVLGTMLVLGWRLRDAAMATAAFLVVFGGFIAYGWSAGTLQECGCFGPLLQRTPPQALAQDVGMLALAILGVIWTPRGGRRMARNHYGVLATIAVVSVALIGSTLIRDTATLETQLASSEPTVDGGVTFDDLDFRNNDYLLYLFHPTCPHCIENAPRVARILEDSGLPELIGITHSVQPGAVDIYMRQVGRSFKAFVRSAPGFVQITGDGGVPQLVFLKRGKIARVWKGDLPSPSDLRKYLSLQ